MPFLLAGFSSMTFGVADFIGAVAARRAPVVSVVLTSQIVGGAGVLLIAPLVSEGLPGPREWAWGAGAGLAGGVGLVLLYHALATTRISVTAPVAALFGTATPVLFGLAIGERPASSAWVGVALGMVAVVLIARPSGAAADELIGGLKAAGYGAVVGVAFGVFGILISRTGTETGLWPLVSARGASIMLLLLVAAATGRPVVAPTARGLAATAGALDMLANVAFLVAVRLELLSLVSVIMSLYPVSTVALARVVLGERVGGVQLGGLLLGGVAVALIVLA